MLTSTRPVRSDQDEPQPELVRLCPTCGAELFEFCREYYCTSCARWQFDTAEGED